MGHNEILVIGRGAYRSEIKISGLYVKVDSSNQPVIPKQAFNLLSWISKKMGLPLVILRPPSQSPFVKVSFSYEKGSTQLTEVRFFITQAELEKLQDRTQKEGRRLALMTESDTIEGLVGYLENETVFYAPALHDPDWQDLSKDRPKTLEDILGHEANTTRNLIFPRNNL